MAEAGHIPIRMILPPDGRQTRIDFFGENSRKRQHFDFWNTLSSMFRHEHKEGVDLDLFMQELEKEGYSEKSRQSYLFMVRKFFEYFDGKSPGQISMSHIEDYNFEYFVSGRYSRSYQLQFTSALRLYYQLILGIDLNLKQLRKSGSIR